MYIARILYPVQVLGPGNRIGIWFNGCTHGCEGCSNPELWQQQERYRTTAETVLELIDRICRTQTVEGFTLTGGDPFAQPEALRLLLPKLQQESKDILVYTGYSYAEVQQSYPDILEQIGVLIDGKYVQERNNGAVLRGSDNQNVLVLRPSLEEKYHRYLQNTKNEIQNFTARDGVISVGIHRPDYEERVDILLRGKGLKNI